MLDSHTDCEVFLHHRNVRIVQHFKHISSTMPHSKNTVRGKDFCRFSVLLVLYSCQLAIFLYQLFHVSLKEDLSAVSLNCFPHFSHDMYQLIRSDMWFCQIENFFRCTAFYKALQHKTNSRILNASCQFAI